MQEEHDAVAEPVRTIEIDAGPERWPTVIGVLGIVFSSLCAVGFACGLLGPLIQSFFLSKAPADQQEQMRVRIETQRQLTMPYPAVQYGVNLIVVLVAVVLLIGAIQILRRSRAGAKTLVLYSWLDLVMSFIGAGLGLFVVTGILGAVKQDPSLGQAVGGTLGMKIMMPMVVVTFVLKCIWPAFLLIWFGRDSIKDAVDRWDLGYADDSDAGAGA